MAELKNLIVNGVVRVNGDAYVSDMIYGTASHAISASWAPMPSFTDTDRYVATASFASTGSKGANGVKMTLTRRGSDTGTVVATIPVASTSAAGVVTGAQVTSWNGAATNSHTHSNKAVLDGITAADTASWDSAATNNHTHSNKAVLDGITAAKTASWDAKQAAISDLATIRTNAASGNVAFGWGNHADAGYLKSTGTIATASYNAAGTTALAWITSNSASALKNDATTYAGHYTPSASGATAKGSSAARTYLKTVSVDGKGHVVGFTTGSETVTNTDTKVTAVGNHYTPAQSAGKSVSAGQVMVGVGVDAAGHVVAVTGSSAITASCLGVAANTSASVAAAIAAKWTYNENTIKGVKVNNATAADSATTATKLAGTSGSLGIPVYINAGVPTACNANIVSLPLSSSGATTGTLTLVPGKVHKCGTLTGNLTLALGTDNTYTHEAIYCCKFNMGATLRTITLPSGVKVMENSVALDTVNRDYEINIMDNIAIIARTEE